MLTKSENESLTRVGPGTPMGNLFRKYWQPIYPAAQLEKERITRLRILGEDLVLFRLPSGKYGLMAERCSHRGTSLNWGFLEESGIRCAYHGWKYDCEGKCIEQPFEPKESIYKEKIRQTSYPIQVKAGIIWAYMGTLPAPLLYPWDLIHRTDGARAVIFKRPNINWLQIVENELDPVHPYYLHGMMSRLRGINKAKEGDDFFKPFFRPIESIDFVKTEFGMRNLRTWVRDGVQETNTSSYVLFPNMCRIQVGSMSVAFRVPIDDENTQTTSIAFGPSPDGRAVDQPDTQVPYKWGSHRETPNGDYDMTFVVDQDYMAMQTAGTVFDRSKEHLGASDRGIALYRQMLAEQLELVKQGKDPMNVFRKEREIVRFENVGANVYGTEIYKQHFEEFINGRIPVKVHGGP